MVKAEETRKTPTKYRQGNEVREAVELNGEEYGIMNMNGAGDANNDLAFLQESLRPAAAAGSNIGFLFGKPGLESKLKVPEIRLAGLNQPVCESIQPPYQNSKKGRGRKNKREDSFIVMDTTKDGYIGDKAVEDILLELDPNYGVAEKEKPVDKKKKKKSSGSRKNKRNYEAEEIEMEVEFELDNDSPHIESPEAEDAKSVEDAKPESPIESPPEKESVFKTDREYLAGSEEEDSGELESWEPDPDVKEPELNNPSERSGRRNGGWTVDEMFKANDKLGVQSSFKGIEGYSTVAPHGDDEARKKADRIANEIERNQESQRNANLENDDEERDIVPMETNILTPEDTPKSSPSRSEDDAAKAIEEVVSPCETVEAPVEHVQLESDLDEDKRFSFNTAAPTFVPKVVVPANFVPPPPVPPNAMPNPIVNHMPVAPQMPISIHPSMNPQTAPPVSYQPMPQPMPIQLQQVMLPNGQVVFAQVAHQPNPYPQQMVMPPGYPQQMIMIPNTPPQMMPNPAMMPQQQPQYVAYPNQPPYYY